VGEDRAVVRHQGGFWAVRRCRRCRPRSAALALPKQDDADSDSYRAESADEQFDDCHESRGFVVSSWSNTRSTHMAAGAFDWLCEGMRRMPPI
jgi:hypothetical protein